MRCGMAPSAQLWQTACNIRAIMQPNTRAATASRPNRVLIALAAAWIILSLAIGGAVHADSTVEARPAPATSTDSTQG